MNAVNNYILFSGETNAALLCLLAVTGAIAWAGIHFLRRGGRGALRFAVHAAVGFMALIVAADAARRFVVLATGWPVWVILLAGAVAVEVGLELYALECRTAPKRSGFLMAFLRSLAILIVTAILCQPVFVKESARDIPRTVCVLVDESASMRVVDTGASKAEALRNAELLGFAPAKRIYRFDEAAVQFGDIRYYLAKAGDAIRTISQAAQATNAEVQKVQLADLHAQLKSVAASARDCTDTQRRLLSALDSGQAVTNADLRKELAAINAVLGGDVEWKLTSLTQYIPDDSRKFTLAGAQSATNLIADLHRSVLGLMPRFRKVATAVDEVCFDLLPGEDRREILAMAGSSRTDAAARALFGVMYTGQTHAASVPAAQALGDKYQTRFYRFSASASECGQDELRQSLARRAAENDELKTDLATAIEKAGSDVPSEQLAGIVIFTDGRHNGIKPVEPIAQRFGVQKVPVHTVLLGKWSEPPRDAAVVSVTAADMVHTNDNVLISTEVKLDGLAGTNVMVRLFDGTNMVDSRAVQISSASLRRKVDFPHAPRIPGLHYYSAGIDMVAGETCTNNNSQKMPVMVSGDQTRMLIIEGRPRWEFRYLKNLFSGRDTSVRMQYVLMNQESIDRVEKKPLPPASTQRAADDSEAGSLPLTEQEWMKFDVIVLGDVDPAALGTGNMAILQKFVTDRGGVLIAISGQMYMPHAYTGTPVAGVLPVSFFATERAVTTAPESSFRIALTGEGMENVIMRLDNDADRSAAIWAGLPEIHWRHSIRGVRDGASVLAYAVPPDAPPYIQLADGKSNPDLAEFQKRKAYERENALVVLGNAGLGRVLFMSFDHSWRLRYKQGDTYHHRFWGQAIRLNNPYRMPYGTAFLKIGTDKSRYQPEEKIAVNVRVLNHDFAPVTGANLGVTVMAGDRRVMDGRLEYIKDSAGVYRCALGALPEGEYTVELAGAGAGQLIAGERLQKLQAEFSVVGSPPSELVELAADDGLAGRIASFSGGKVLGLEDAPRLAGMFGKSREVVVTREQYDIWKSLPLLLGLLLVLGAEWLTRKKAGLP